MNSYPDRERPEALPSIARISLFLLLLCTAVNAQSGGGDDGIGTGGSNTIRGRVYLPSGPGDVRIKVRLESTDMANLSTVTDVNGSFRFSGLQGGNYTIIIDGDDYYETYRESISIEKQSSLNGKSTRTLTVPIYLRFRTRSGSAPAIGTVDAALAKVPQAAQNSYRTRRRTNTSYDQGPSRQTIDLRKTEAVALITSSHATASTKLTPGYA